MIESVDVIPAPNVSSVRLLSPFRYPGGKTWLVPLIRRWLSSINPRPAAFIEPFAGGAIAGLTVASERLAEHVILVEIDRKVGAFWEAVITMGLGMQLAERVETYDLTPQRVAALLARQDLDLCDLAFQTIVHNRVSRGGIIADGAGLLNKGENGRGLVSRWYPETLAKRIRHIHQIRGRLSFLLGDGYRVIEDNAHRSDAVFFVDPPYTAGNGKRAGRRLYTHSDVDHEALFELMRAVRGVFLMTCENSEDVRELADRYGFDRYPVAMKSTHHAQMTELLIGRDLSWIGC